MYFERKFKLKLGKFGIGFAETFADLQNQLVLVFYWIGHCLPYIFFSLKTECGFAIVVVHLIAFVYT